MFKKYWEQLIQNKKALILAIIAALVGAFNFVPSGYYEEDYNYTDDEQQYTVESNLNDEEQQQLDEAYYFVRDNIYLEANDYIIIDVIRGENSIIIRYTYNEEHTATMRQKGITQEELISISENVGEVSLSVKDDIQLELGYDVIVDTEVYDSEGYLYLLVRNGQLLEINPLNPTNDNGGFVVEEPKQEQQEGQEERGGMTFESEAPYGRCPKCNCANVEDKGYQGDYCDDCYQQIKDEEWAEKNKYGQCPDCALILTKNMAEQYGGYCPECYGRRHEQNYENGNIGHCERCGDPVDMRHTNDGWGYDHLCGACTGELQEQESMQDANPYAG